MCSIPCCYTGKLLFFSTFFFIVYIYDDVGAFENFFIFGIKFLKLYLHGLAQGVNKGVLVEKLFLMMEREHGSLPDRVLCVGDDRSGEDMLESIESLMNDAPGAEVFACTVGQNQARLSITQMIQLRSSRCCKAWHQPLNHWLPLLYPTLQTLHPSICKYQTSSICNISNFHRHHK